MIEKTVRPVGPVYLWGASWVVCGMIFPLYKLWALLLTAAVSVAVYLVASRLMPAKTIQVEVPVKPFDTGKEELDATLNKGMKDVERLRALNVLIEDQELSVQIDRMVQAGRGILEEVAKNPAKAGKIRSFVNYYLPFTVRILTAYADSDASGSTGENVRRLKADVKDNAAMIASAFEKQLDNLFASELLDITTDIDVLEQILKGDGLSDQW